MVTGNITAKDAIFIILSSFISTTWCHTQKKNHQKFAWPFNHTFFVRRAWGKLCAWLSGYKKMKNKNNVLVFTVLRKIKNKATKENISIYFDNCYSRIKNIRKMLKLVFRKSMSILIHKHIHNLWIKENLKNILKIIVYA